MKTTFGVEQKPTFLLLLVSSSMGESTFKVQDQAVVENIEAARKAFDAATANKKPGTQYVVIARDEWRSRFWKFYEELRAATGDDRGCKNCKHLVHHLRHAVLPKCAVFDWIDITNANHLACNGSGYERRVCPTCGGGHPTGCCAKDGHGG